MMEFDGEQANRRHRLILSWSSIIASFGAVANIVLAVFTYSLLKEGVAARAISERSLIEANRAWVAPAGISFSSPVVIGREGEYFLEFRNTGRQPALNVLLDHSIQVITRNSPSDPWPETGKKTGSCDTKLGNGTLYPLDRTMGQSFTLPKEYITSNLLQGIAALVVQGCFRYQTFEQVHRSGFCWSLKQQVGRDPKDWGWNLCTNGNFAD